jgi:hypothetical protein
LKKYRNHRRKQIEKQSIFVRGYAVEVIQETEKDFNNAMGQESLTVLINPKEKTNKKPKSAGKNHGENKIIANNKNQQKYLQFKRTEKPATRKPIIITKNEAKK